MRYLRQSTAAVVSVGVFASPSTGFPVTNLTDQSANGRLIKNGTGAAITVSSWAPDAQGQYLVGLSTAHTDTLGKMRLAFSDGSTYLPVWEDFTVLSAAVYDTLFGAVALSTYAGGAVSGVTNPVTVGTNNDKTGYALAAGTVVTLASGVVKDTPTPTANGFTVTLANAGTSATFVGNTARFETSDGLQNATNIIAGSTISGNDRTLTFSTPWDAAPAPGDTLEITG